MHIERTLRCALCVLGFVLAASAALGDSGKIFYFALPGNSVGRYTGDYGVDNLRSVYHIVVERAPGANGASDPNSEPITFSVQFLHNGFVHPYTYWIEDSSHADFPSKEFTDIPLNYGAPVGIELETLFDPDGPAGTDFGDILVSTDTDRRGGVQEGVFRIVATGDVRVLLYNVDGPYIDRDASDNPSDGYQAQYGPGFADGAFAPDVTRLYPINNLGESYTLNIDIPDRVILNPAPKASVTVVATRDATQLTFQASPQMVNARDGAIPAPASVTLNRGQLWTMTADEYELLLLEKEADHPEYPAILPYMVDSAMNLLNGMKIEASKPVAVITAGGCASNRDSTCDQTLLQLLPDRLLGETYHVPLTVQDWNDGFDLRIVAAEALTELKVSVKVDGSFASDDVIGQAGWGTSGGTQVFDLVSAEDPVFRGGVWDVVWTPFITHFNPKSTAERPGIDYDNRRLTLGIFHKYGGFDANVQADWINLLHAESPSGTEFPSGTMMLSVNSGRFNSAVMTIESDSPISVVMSPRISGLEGGSMALTAPDDSVNLGEKSTLHELRAGNDIYNDDCLPETPGDPTVCHYTIDSACGLHLVDPAPHNWVEHVTVLGSSPDPSRIQLAPVELYQNQVTVSVPTMFSECYVGDPQCFGWKDEEFCTYDVPFAHYMLVIVHQDYLSTSSSSTKRLGLKASYNTLGGAADDTSWARFTPHWVGIERSLMSPLSVCREAFADESWVGGGSISPPGVMYDIWTTVVVPMYGGNFDGMAPNDYNEPVVRRTSEWVPYPSGQGAGYKSAVFRVVLPNVSSTDVAWDETNGGDSALFPYNTSIAHEPGDLVPDAPTVTYQFALLDETEPGTGLYEIDGSPGADNAKLMVYPFGIGNDASYGYLGSIPYEDPPASELVLSDRIPLAPGNTVVGATATLSTDSGVPSIELTDGSGMRLLPADDGAAVELVVDFLDEHIFDINEGDEVTLSYELELRNLEPGVERLVGEQTSLEYYLPNPEIGQTSSAIQNRGATTIPIGNGPIILGVETDSPQYTLPDNAVQMTGTLTLDMGAGILRDVIGSTEEFDSPEHEYNGVRVVDDATLGHDLSRSGTLMLERTGGSSIAPFVSTGTVSFVFDAGRTVEWRHLGLIEGLPQPQVPGANVVYQSGFDAFVISARPAGSLAEIQSWRVDEASAPGLRSIGQADADPFNSGVGFAVETFDLAALPPADRLHNSRFLEVVIDLSKWTENLVDFSPVLESLTVGYVPTALVVDLDVLDNQENQVHRLGSFPVAVVDTQQTVSAAFTSGDYLVAGNYIARASLIDQSINEVLAVAMDEFELVLPGTLDEMIDGAVFVDRSSYIPGERMEIQSTVTNLMAQPWDNDLTVTLRVYEASALSAFDCDNPPVSLYTFPSYRIYQIGSGEAHLEARSWFIPSGGGIAPGDYAVVQQIDTETTTLGVLECNNTLFAIEFTNEIAGSISTSLAQVSSDTTTEFSIEILNSGSVDLTNVQLAVELEPIAGGAAVLLDPLGGPVPLAIGEMIEPLLLWTPEVTTPYGFYSVTLYAYADEFVGITELDYTTWLQPGIAGIEVVAPSGEVEIPWYVAVELEPYDNLLGGSEVGVGGYRGGINERGEIVGTTTVTNASSASIWRDCPTPEDLSVTTLAQASLTNFGSYSYATDVSDDGIVVGVYEDSITAGLTRAFVADTNVSGSTFELTAADSLDSVVIATVNSMGQSSVAAGWMGDGVSSTAVIWPDVLTSHAGIVPENLLSGGFFRSGLVDINDAGIAVGWFFNGSRYTALWVDSAGDAHMSNAGWDGDIRLHGISDTYDGSSPYVMGSYTENGVEVPFKAVLGADGFTLNGHGLSVPAGNSAQPLALARVDNIDTIVGTMTAGSTPIPYFYENNIGVDLNTVVLNDHHGWNIEAAVDISSGTRAIAGYGSLNSNPRAVRLDRVPYQGDLLDALHFWVRADAGVTNALGSVSVWNDLIDEVGDGTIALSITGDTPFPTIGQADCCEVRVVRFDGTAMPMTVAGIVDGFGSPLSGSSTFAMVFVPFDTENEEIVRLGTGVNAVELRVEDGMLFAYSDSNTASASLGWVEAGEPVMVMMRQMASNNAVTVWRDWRDPQDLVVAGLANWSDIVLGSWGANPGDMGVAEMLVFETDLSEEDAGFVRDGLMKKHRVSNPINTEDAVLWVRSDRDVTTTAGSPATVTRWGDQAGSWGDLSVPASATGPVYQAATYACLPSLYFDGSTLLGGVGPVDVVMVLDHSGSMYGNNSNTDPTLSNPVCQNEGESGVNYWNRRFVFARESARELAGRLLDGGNPLDHRVGLLSFDDDDNDTDDNYLELAMTNIGADVFSNDLVAVTDRVCEWSAPNEPTPWGGRPNGGTNIPRALSVAEDALSLEPTDRRQAVVFLTDGDPQLNHNGNDVTSWSYLQLFSDDASHIGQHYNMHQTLADLRDANTPVHTIGFKIPVGSEPVGIGEDMPADLVMQTISDMAGPGGIVQNADGEQGLHDVFLELLDNLSGAVEAATIELVFSAHDVPVSGDRRVLLQTGYLTDPADGHANGLNVWLYGGEIHIGVWWKDSSNNLQFRSMAAPIQENVGLDQLVIKIRSNRAQLSLNAFLNGIPFVEPGGGAYFNGTGDGSTNGTTSGVGGNWAAVGGSSMEIETRSLTLGNLILGGAGGSQVRIDSDTLVSATGFQGDLVEFLVYDKALVGKELESLFNWGIDRYGAGSLTRGYAPIAIAGPSRSGDNAVFDLDFDGVEQVGLNAGGTYDPDDPVERLRYNWYIGDQLIASGEAPTVTLPRGRHHISLRVSDPAGHVSEDRILVDVTRVLYQIKPVEISFDLEAGQAVGDPVPVDIPVSPQSGTKVQVVGAATPLYQAGRSAAAIDLDGAAYIDLTAVKEEIPLGAAPRTISVWFEAGVTEHDESTLFMQASENGSGVFAITGNRRRVAYSVDGYTRGVEWLEPIDQLKYGWHHLAVVVQTGALWADQVRMYLDGVELRTVPLDGSGAPGNLYTVSDAVYVGGRVEPNGDVEHYQGGRIDELLVFSGALSSSEVADLYNKVPVAAWGFEQQAGWYSVASTAIVPTVESTLLLTNGAALDTSGRLTLSSRGMATTAGPVFSMAQRNWSIFVKIKPDMVTDELVPLVSDSTGPVLMLYKDAAGIPLLYVATTGNSIPAYDLMDGNEHWVAMISRKNFPGVSDGTFLFIDNAVDFGSPVSALSTALDGGPIQFAGPNDANNGFVGTFDDLFIFERPLDEAEYLETTGQD